MNQQEKLDILKNILLTDEREYAEEIFKKIKTLEETINKKNQLSEKVDPIIDEKLQEFLKKLPEVIGPSITETLKHEIENSKDAVVEALFPIMGKMIKRYIQHEMQLLSEKINSQVSNTFSFKSKKRKAKAEKTGVSEGELIIQEQIKPIVEQLMVINKGSGLIISEYSRTQNIDEDMVAGMLTAIKSFAEDAFEKEDIELQYIEYESYHIHLQNFSSYYIAVIISGPYNVIFKGELEDKLLNFAQNVVNKEDLSNRTKLNEKLKLYFENENI